MTDSGGGSLPFTLAFPHTVPAVKLNEEERARREARRDRFFRARRIDRSGVETTAGQTTCSKSLITIDRDDGDTPHDEQTITVIDD